MNLSILSMVLYTLALLCLIASVYLTHQSLTHQNHEIKKAMRANNRNEHMVLRWLVQSSIDKNLSRKVQAEALRAVAKEYDSPTGKHRLAVVARTAGQGGPSVPALWLLATADVLDPPVEDDHSDHEHTYGGTCIQ